MIAAVGGAAKAVATGRARRDQGPAGLAGVAPAVPEVVRAAPADVADARE